MQHAFIQVGIFLKKSRTDYVQLALIDRKREPRQVKVVCVCISVISKNLK